MATNEQAKFYEKCWFCVLMLILFAPVGIVFLWKYKHFSKNISIILTAASAIFFIFLLATSPNSEDDSLNEDTQMIFYYSLNLPKTPPLLPQSNPNPNIDK